jgi:hypothetical protein
MGRDDGGLVSGIHVSSVPYHKEVSPPRVFSFCMILFKATLLFDPGFGPLKYICILWSAHH